MTATDATSSRQAQQVQEKHATRHTSHVTRHTSYATLLPSPAALRTLTPSPPPSPFVQLGWPPRLARPSAPCSSPSRRHPRTSDHLSLGFCNTLYRYWNPSLTWRCFLCTSSACLVFRSDIAGLRSHLLINDACVQHPATTIQYHRHARSPLVQVQIIRNRHEQHVHDHRRMFCHRRGRRPFRRLLQHRGKQNRQAACHPQILPLA
jgi:hypothetical protein